MRLPGIIAAVAGLLSVGAAHAQDALRLESSGQTIDYQLTRFAGAAVTDEVPVAEGSALGTARLIARHLAAGDIEEAALLSNSPKRRFEVLAEYRESVGPQEFRRVYAEYADARNPLVAEIAIGPHRALLWRMGSAGTLAAQYYVDVDGRFLLDDVPSDERARLRKVVEAYRSGERRLPDDRR